MYGTTTDGTGTTKDAVVGMSPVGVIVSSDTKHLAWVDNLKRVNTAVPSSCTPGGWFRCQIDTKTSNDAFGQGGDQGVQVYLRDILLEFSVRYAGDTRSAYCLNPWSLFGQVNLYCNDTLIGRHFVTGTNQIPQLAATLSDHMATYDDTYAKWQGVPSTQAQGRQGRNFAQRSNSNILCLIDAQTGAGVTPYNPTLTLSLNRLFGKMFTDFPAKKADYFVLECQFLPTQSAARSQDFVWFDNALGSYANLTFNNIQARQVVVVTDYHSPFLDAPLFYMFHGYDWRSYSVTLAQDTKTSLTIDLFTDFPTRRNIEAIVWCFGPCPTVADSTIPNNPFVYNTANIDFAPHQLWKVSLTYLGDEKHRIETYREWQDHRERFVAKTGNTEFRTSPFFPAVGDPALLFYDFTQACPYPQVLGTKRVENNFDNTRTGYQITLSGNEFNGALPASGASQSVWVYVVYQRLVSFAAGMNYLNRSAGQVKVHVNTL